MANDQLHIACRKGDYESAIDAINKGAKQFDWGLAIACSAGNKDIVKLMITMGATAYNWGLAEACYDGNTELAELMIEKGATNFDRGLTAACYAKNKKLILLLLEKGANIYDCDVELDIVSIEYLLIKNNDRYITRFNIKNAHKNIDKRKQILNIIFNRDIISDLMLY